MIVLWLALGVNLSFTAVVIIACLLSDAGD